MRKFVVQAKVDQIVTKSVTLEIEASDEDEAVSKARDALSAYPEPVGTEGVRRMLTTKSHYWIPRDVQFESVQEEKEGGRRG